MATALFNKPPKNNKRAPAPIPEAEPPEDEPRVSTNILLPESIVRRIATYTWEKHAGKAHIRNKLIMGWVDKGLKEEGY